MIKAINKNKALPGLGIALLLLVLGIVPALAQNSNPVRPRDQVLLFEQANRLYDNGNFEKAAGIYRQLVNSDYESGNLYFNLGNAYYKMNRMGLAILYYEKAQRLIPQDAGLKNNLAAALTGVDEGEINWTREFSRSLTYLATLNQLTLVCSACFFLFVLGIVLMILAPVKIKSKKTGKISLWYQSILFLVGCLLLVLVSLTALTYLDRQQPQAIAIKGAVAVFSQPDSGSSTYFNLAEGTRLIVNETRGGWCLIKRQDGKRGWVQKHFLAKL